MLRDRKEGSGRVSTDQDNVTVSFLVSAHAPYIVSTQTSKKYVAWKKIKYYGIFIIILTGRTSSRRRNIPQNIPCIDQSCCRKEWPTKQFGSSILLLLLLLPRQQHQSLLFPTIFFVLHLLSQTFTRTTNRKQELPLPTSLLNLPNATFSASLGN